jgi:hypothetical protein
MYIIQATTKIACYFRHIHFLPISNEIVIDKNMKILLTVIVLRTTSAASARKNA